MAKAGPTNKLEVRFGRREGRFTASGVQHLISALVAFCDQSKTETREFRGVPEKDGNNSKDTTVILETDRFIIERANVRIELTRPEARKLLTFLEQHQGDRVVNTTKLTEDESLRAKLQKKMVLVLRYEAATKAKPVPAEPAPSPAAPPKRRRPRLCLVASAPSEALQEVDIIPGRGISRGPQVIPANELEEVPVVLSPSSEQVRAWADFVVD